MLLFNEEMLKKNRWVCFKHNQRRLVSNLNSDPVVDSHHRFLPSPTMHVYGSSYKFYVE